MQSRVGARSCPIGRAPVGQPPVGESLRWGDLLGMAADLAFETDGLGQLVFLIPETVLGWSAQALLRKPADALLASPCDSAGLNPFRATLPVRGRRTWLNRAGGGQVCVRFTCTPLLDAAGKPAGTRGIGIVETEIDMPRPWAPETGIDRLTGLPNRHGFLIEMARRIERLDWDQQPSTLICANLDGFRALNDTLGRAEGDRVLVKAAALLTRTFRPTDLIGRLGGDAFAVWMSGADHMTAAERAEDLHLAIPRTVAALIGPDAPPIGVSIGIAPRNLGVGESVETLMRRAERAMEAVKHGGRGHWRVAHVGGG